MTEVLEIHGRRYRRPAEPTVVVCLDGFDPAYADAAISAHRAPTLARWRSHGLFTLVSAAMPTFTNTNNASIVTGAPPRAHGISGNHCFVSELGRDVALTERRFLRIPTILETMSDAGVRVMSATAKAKLAGLIGPRREADALSAELGGKIEALANRTAPPIYSAEASLFVLDAGMGALQGSEPPELLYLSTTDYVQHKHAPETEDALAFMEAVDARLARLEQLAGRIVITGDHGMNDKTHPDGTPKVVFVEELVRSACEEAHVTLPITDPYVRHHGSLGGTAMIDRLGDAREKVREMLSEVEGIEEVLTREEAAEQLELPKDRIGDLVVLGDLRTVLGRTSKDHDLEMIRGLRSHGSRHEQTVPLISNTPSEFKPTRNYDAMAVALSES